ncbi:ATP-binding cassette domain-containing protein [Actinomadura sp. HBU206391]|uniref:ATP-binding cassette domain-containing protein n=1 Tax=Actinomadura sp. HBU206391 TaxID=2731692 RepID=UPI00164F4BDD|nr:ATP-binding cassette domain-containing protein [Actinomadura sp. HBU206391]MBC6459306.1 ATP-binding cassette domain-containing protein [Actinomadura sp. HBU206391]
MDEVPTARPRCSISGWIRGRTSGWITGGVRSRISGRATGGIRGRISGRVATVFDIRLARHAPATTRCLVVCMVLASGTAACVIAQAALLAHALSALAVPPALAAVVAVRAVLAWAGEFAAHRTAAEVASRLRTRLLARAVRNGPCPRPTEPAALVARVDALAPYFSRCLPRLSVAVVVPAAMLAALAVADLLSAGIVLATLALFALCGRLVGGPAAARAVRQRRTADALAAHFTDLVAGLPTLTVYGRARAQGWHIARATEQYRMAALVTSRLSFRSALVLEAAATFSVALVVLSAGLRLASGALTLQSALFAALLTVEAGLPLHRLTGHLRAGRGSLAAVGGILDFLETPARPAERGSARSWEGNGGSRGGEDCSRGGQGGPGGGERGDLADPRSLTIRVEDVVIARSPGPSQGAVSLTLTPGTTTALAGPPGAGKSDLIAALLGFETPIAGRIMVGDRRLVAGESWRNRIAWVPQRPALFAGTVADNIAVAVPGARADAVAKAAAAAGVTSSTHLDARLGPGGSGLSTAGRRQVALARAVLRCDLLDPPLLLFDEPTADLGVLAEIEMAEAIGALLPGRTALIVTRRRTLLGRADHVVALGRPGAAPMPVPA